MALQFVTQSFPDAIVGIFYNVIIEVTGGVSGTYIDVSSGAVPAEMLLSGNVDISDFEPALFGTAYVPGLYTFTLTAYDDVEADVSQTFTLRIIDPADEISGFEVFKLPCVRESSESVGFAEYKQALGPDGVRSQSIDGNITGLKRFSYMYNQIPKTSQQGVTLDDIEMSQAKYIRDLFHRTKVSGLPFVIQSQENEQNYLVEFSESEQGLQRKLAAMYASKINMVQTRIEGRTVFDPRKFDSLFSWIGRVNSDYFVDVVEDNSGNGLSFAYYNDVTPNGTVQNGLKTQRFNAVAGDGLMVQAGTVTIYDAIFVLKINEATFSNDAGILTNNDAIQHLVGDTGTTKFQDLGFGGDYEFRKDGVLYAENNQQAPMNAFSIIHCRWKGGITMGVIQVGLNLNLVGTYGKFDLGEMAVFNAPTPMNELNEYIESLQIIWETPAL